MNTNFSEESIQTVYISVGCDCAVAYHLRKLDLCHEAFPFDWIKINNVKQIKETLDNNFSLFFENYELINSSDNFNNSDDNSIKSKVKIKLSNNMILPHEAKDIVFNFEEYKEKYMKRINRFNSICRDLKIKKVFVRADNQKLKDEYIKLLHDSLNSYNVQNYIIKFIDYSQFVIPSDYVFDWHRDYINWVDIL
jgi:hypothetical protein